MAETPADNGKKRPRDKSRYMRGQSGGGRTKSRQNGWECGQPGVLLTCETGREGKCRREGLEILRHQPNLKGGSDGNLGAGKNEESIVSNGADEGMSIEEEIAMLKGGATAEEVLASGSGYPGSGRETQNPQFTPVDTGCKGTVFLACVLPKSSLSTIKSEDSKKKTGNEEAMTKKRKVDPDNERNDICINDIHNNFSWDPLEAVKHILNELKDNGNGGESRVSETESTPRSRFITRMIPIQATCFVSLEDIGKTARLLSDKFILPLISEKERVSFEVTFKRRNCSKVRREEVISAVAKVVGELGSQGKNEKSTEFTVDLTNPDFTILIEIWKTVCGMSVVRNCKSFRRFNLFENKEQTHNKEQNEKS